MNHGSPFLDHRSAPVPPPPEAPRLGVPHPPAPLTLQAFDPVVAAAAPRRGRPWVNLVLFLATVASTTLMGASHYQGFVSGYDVTSPTPFVLWRGLWYSVTILAILGAHELGHYYACRYYRVDASLPYFLPAPFLTGTLGAVIRIRQPIPTKPMLFDIGVAGPIAGFVVVVPALFLGLSLSRVLPLPEDFVGLSLGEPLLFRLAAWMIWGPAPDGYSLNPPPGGTCRLVRPACHSPQPVPDRPTGRRSHFLCHTWRSLHGWSAITAVAAVILLAVYRLGEAGSPGQASRCSCSSAFGPRHPRTLDHHIPLDRTRLLVAVGAVVIFILCFTPAPIEFIRLRRRIGYTSR